MGDLFNLIDTNQDHALSREEFDMALRCGLVAPGSRPGTVSRPHSNGEANAFAGMPSVTVEVAEQALALARTTSANSLTRAQTSSMLAEEAVASALAAQKMAAAKAAKAQEAIVAVQQASDERDRMLKKEQALEAKEAAEAAQLEHTRHAALTLKKAEEARLAAKVAVVQELQAEEARLAVAAAETEEARVTAERAALDKIPVPPEWKAAVADAEQRIAAAKLRRQDLKQDEADLRKENEELKQFVAKARCNVERVILKKRADNVQMLADNAELERFTMEARRLAEQKSKLNPSKSIDGNSDWEVLQKDNMAIRRKLERVLARPQRMPLGTEMASPRSNLSSLEATPRIAAVQEWRASSTTTSGEQAWSKFV